MIAVDFVCFGVDSGIAAKTGLTMTDVPEVIDELRREPRLNLLYK